MDKFDPANVDVDWLVDNIPADDELLVPLGQIVWASIRLNAGIRDMLLNYTGTEVNPYELQIGAALNQLHDFAVESGDTEVVEWIAKIARPANRARARAIHSTVYTAEDDKQAIQTWKANERLQRPELRLIAAQIVHASYEMPKREYTWTA